MRLSHATKPAGDKTPEHQKVAAHASEGSAKPRKEPSRATHMKTEKASSRVDKQLEKTKRRRSRHPKPGIGYHPGHTQEPRATAASAGSSNEPAGWFGETPSAFAFWSSLKPTGPGQPFVGPGFAGETTVDASVPGVDFHVDWSTGDVTVVGDNYKLFTVSFGMLTSHAGTIVEGLLTAAAKLKSGVTTRPTVVDGNTVTFNLSSAGVSYSEVSPQGVRTTMTLNLTGQLEISIAGTANAPTGHGHSQAVNLAVATTLTPVPPPGTPGDGKPRTVVVPIQHPATHHSGWLASLWHGAEHDVSSAWHTGERFVASNLRGDAHLYSGIFHGIIQNFHLTPGPGFGFGPGPGDGFTPAP